MVCYFDTISTVCVIEGGSMNFLSLRFFIFFFLVQLLYCIFPKRWRIALLLGANYVFYLSGNPITGLYLVGCTFIAYLCALAIGQGKHRRLWLAVSMVCCFGVLFWFKYIGFFPRCFPGQAVPRAGTAFGIVLLQLYPGWLCV